MKQESDTDTIPSRSHLAQSRPPEMESIPQSENSEKMTYQLTLILGTCLHWLVVKSGFLLAIDSSRPRELAQSLAY